VKPTKEHIAVIRKDFSKLKSKDDLLKLLNKAGHFIYGDKSKRLEKRQLTFYADPILSKDRYQTFVVRKKSGGERQIHAPISGLRDILQLLHYVLNCCGTPHCKAYGFVSDKSIVDNASLHLDKTHVYNLDLQDFFHSFDRKRVKAALMKEPFNLNGKKEPLAFFISCLCTHPIEINGQTRVVLPQGSPTSPLLTNMLCKTLDRRLNGLAKKEGARYSRYADDITFSSDKNVFKRTRFQTELKRIIEEDQELKINHSKTRLQKADHRQEVTGLTVNRKVNVNSRYVKQIRMWIYYWERYGYKKASELFSRDYELDKGHVKVFIPPLERVLKGKLDYLKMVKGGSDPTYLKLLSRYSKLKKTRNKDLKSLQNNVSIKFEL
jgi:hypothetical protein